MVVRPGNYAVRMGPLICYPTVNARPALLLMVKGFEYKFIDIKRSTK